MHLGQSCEASNVHSVANSMAQELISTVGRYSRRREINPSLEVSGLEIKTEKD